MISPDTTEHAASVMDDSTDAIAAIGSRKIVHVDMDAFYASVEQRDDPALKGRPVVVAWKGKRSVVCAASYEARRFGVRSAMPAITAERMCPEAIFLPPDLIRYKAVSKAVREIFQRHTDDIEPLSLDEAYLDVTVNKTGLKSATLVAKTIRQQIWDELNLTASAGIAPNKFIAKIASDWRKPNGQFVVQPHEVPSFLMPLPVGKIPGVGKVTEARMAGVGIRLLVISTQWISRRSKVNLDVGAHGCFNWRVVLTTIRWFPIEFANRFPPKTHSLTTSHYPSASNTFGG